MKVLRRTTALISIASIFIGGIMETQGSTAAEPFIFGGVLVLILVYIPVFLLHISKKWDQEDQELSQDQRNQSQD